MKINEKALKFIKEETEFHLGTMPTEQSNTKTASLSQTLQSNTAEGIKLLQSVDDDIVPVAEQVFGGESFGKLVDSLIEAMNGRKRIFFSGCGATGRLSILLEACWRKFWQETMKARPAMMEKVGDLEDLVCSVMTGADRALVRSVENFEDYQQFGRHQIAERGVAKGDVVVAITEGGETSSVIGTAWQGIDAGAEVFFVFNNPAEVLSKYVKRSREVIEDERITKLDLCSGPMAVAGSTRMQATTSELLVVGAALELALAGYLRSRLTAGQLAELDIEERSATDYAGRFAALRKQLGKAENLSALAKLAEYEDRVYSENGRVTYFADDFLLDIFTDTTERAPTFTLPPFRKCDDKVSPPSWVFVKNPTAATQDSWKSVYRREPRGLDWDRSTYEALGASEKIINNPPELSKNDIYKFLIGNEDDTSRYEGCFGSAILLVAGADGQTLREQVDSLKSASIELAGRFSEDKAIAIGAAEKVADLCDFNICCDVAGSTLELWTHLAIKLVLNTISTATMGRMGRVLGNWMVCAEASNKKLLDRGTRLVAEIAGLDYVTACHEYFESLDIIAEHYGNSNEFIPPAAFAIYRLRKRDKEGFTPGEPLPRMASVMKELAATSR